MINTFIATLGILFIFPFNGNSSTMPLDDNEIPEASGPKIGFVEALKDFSYEEPIYTFMDFDEDSAEVYEIECVREANDNIWTKINEEEAAAAASRSHSRSSYNYTPQRRLKPGDKVTMTATAYAPTGELTATGTVPEVGRTIATDPNVIPSGTHVLINGQEYIAEDTGGAIKGNIVDIYMKDDTTCNEWGRRPVEVEILG